MEANYFTILRLRPGRYSRNSIDHQYRWVRRKILRCAGGAQVRQRRLDDAWIARCILREPARQAQHLAAVKADVTRRARCRGAAQTAESAAPPTLGPPAGKPSRTRSAAPAAKESIESKDAHERFRELVPTYVESGLLRFTARRRLMLAAEGLGIGQFKANLIIAEVLHDIRDGRIHTGIHPLRENPSKSAAPAGFAYGLRLAVAAAIAVALDLLVIVCLAS